MQAICLYFATARECATSFTPLLTQWHMGNQKNEALTCLHPILCHPELELNHCEVAVIQIGLDMHTKDFEAHIAGPPTNTSPPTPHHLPAGMPWAAVPDPQRCPIPITSECGPTQGERDLQLNLHL